MSARGSAAGKGRGSAMTQKPARRERSATGGHGRARSDSALRKALVYLPLFGKLMLAALTGVLLFMGYRAAASATFFQARNVDLNPTTHASADEILLVVRRATAAKGGVWNANLEAISAELERLPWVRRAVVSRVLPDGVRVRVTERQPLAVVHTTSGKFVWVDEDAVTLGAMSPNDPQPAFFIRGWEDDGQPDAQHDNQLRLQKYSELTRAWDAAKLSERVSEVNLADARDVRVQLAGDDSQIEVRLGNKDFGNRLQRALKVLDEQRNTPRGPFITRIETLDNRTIIGSSSGAQTSSDNVEANPSSTDIANALAPPLKPEAERRASDSRRNKKSDADISKQERERRDKKEQARKEQAKKDETKTRAKGETRPRRIG
ncbi:MAG: cell division protein FtsQ [Blastocatellia bacterium]|jgi:cell division septal protein FtsQ|nr:cell division protein FtsQ [Blastocatellia bacterium]